jgi:hypothetical protein
MPVARRRHQGYLKYIYNLPSVTVKLLDADFLLRKSRALLLYGFAPAVILLGMTLEPQPSSWFELINILE